MTTYEIGRRLWSIQFITSNIQTLALTREMDALNLEYAQGTTTQREGIERNRLPDLRTRIQQLGGTLFFTNQLHPAVNQELTIEEKGHNAQIQRMQDMLK